MTKKTILITGSSGAIGSTLGLALYTQGHTIIGIGLREVENYWLSRFIKKDVIGINEIDIPESIDIIYHCAGYAQTYKHLESPLEIINTCYEGTKKVLELAKIKNCKVVFLSTTLVNDVFNLNDPKHSYIAGKIAAESLCATYNSSGLDVNIIRLNNVFGTKDYNSKFVIPTFIRDIQVGIESKIIDGIYKNFCYINDIIDTLIDIGFKDSSTLLTEMVGESIEIKTLYNMIKTIIYAKTSMQVGLSRMIQ